MVTIQCQATSVAMMNSGCQCFWDGRTTATAINTRMMRGNLFQPATSFFRFVCQYIEKGSPTCVGYAFRQMSIPHHVLDFQIFCCNYPTFVDDISGFLVMKIIPLVSCFPVNIGHPNPCLPAVRTAFLFPGKRSLHANQPCFRFPKIFRVFDFAPVGKRSKCFYANIYPYCLCRDGAFYRDVFD